MVVPNGPDAARSRSTWIHWGSSVAAANASIRSCADLAATPKGRARRRRASANPVTRSARRVGGSEPARRPESLERRLRPSSSRLSYRPGETREPVTATRIGRYTVRGFSPSSSQSRLSAVSISGGRHGSTRSSATPLRRGCARRGASDQAPRRGRGSRRIAGTPRAGRSSPARSALPPAPLRRPVAAMLAEVRDQPRAYSSAASVAQVHAVHPVELRVVERRGARATRSSGSARRARRATSPSSRHPAPSRAARGSS